MALMRSYKLPSVFLILLVAINMSGCGAVTPIPTSESVSISTPMKKPTATFAADNLISDKETQPLIAASALGTAQPSQTFNECLSLILDTKQLSGKEHGAVIIDSIFFPKWTASTFDEPYVFKTPENKTALEINPNLRTVDYHTIAVSPDQTQIAFLYEFLDAGENDFFIFDRNGKLLASMDLPENLRGARIVSWLEKGILLELKYQLGSYNESTNYILFNPFTHVQENLQTSFPNHYPPDFNYRGTDEVYYSPSLDYAVYFAAEKSRINELYYSLWDISNNREVTRLYLSEYSSGVIWAKNSEFAVTQVWLGDQYGLVSIHPNGKIETLVQGEVDGYSISPDSTLLAYWLVDEDRINSSTFHIKNLQTNETRNYCLKTSIPVGMVWSPDSNSLAMSFSYYEDDIMVISVLVDLEKKTAIRIDDVSIPVGWLK